MAKLSGKKALREIDEVLAKARRRLGSVDQEFGGARNSLARLRQAEVGTYAQLARLRLVAIERGGLIEALDEADRKAAQILEERELAAVRLDEEIAATEAALADAEARRADQLTVVDSAGDALDAAEAATQAALEADEVYLTQLKRTEHADFVADQAEEKAAAAAADRAAKGEPYEDDPLFSYLWERGYGTSKYRAWPLPRWLDGTVAKLCDYEPARRNYSLLIEIPVRLSAHAEAMRASFEREAEALAELEDAAAAAAGVPEKSDMLEEAERNLSDFDASIAAREDELRALIDERKSFAAGEDPFYRRCIDALSQAMRRKGIELLEHRAARTASREDDALVRELAALQREAKDIEHDLSQLRRLHDTESGRVGELEDVRRQFKAKRFDDSLSEFINGALIALVLNQFLSGSAHAGEVWKTIERQQRTRKVHADPDFGTLRFPKAGRHGPWRMPGGFGRGGGFGGGGFRTGGGFRGGGGFKTGGGF